MFTVIMKSVSVITLLVTMIIGTGNERIERADIRSEIKIFPIDGKDIPAEMNYQGYLVLSANTTAVNDTLTIAFDLFTQESGGSSIWSETHSSVIIIDGIFNIILGSISSLNPNDFTGDPLWLQTTVGGEVLSPRKKIVSTAYSVKSLVADTALFVLNGTPDEDWTISGNVLYPSAQYGIAMFGNILYGTNSNTHVNLGVNCTTGAYGFDYSNCTIGGGRYNTSFGYGATVAGGYYNTCSAYYSTIGGGNNNTSSNKNATIGGGRDNIVSGGYSTIGGGRDNTISDWYSTIGGGIYNISSGNSSTVGGGYSNNSSGNSSTVSGGYSNTSSNGYSTVGGGRDNTSSNEYATVGGGYNNISSGFYSTVGGGYCNISSASSSTVGGGHSNTSSVEFSTIPGGNYVNVSGICSFGFGRGTSTDSINVTDNYDIVFGDGGDYDYEFGINNENPSYPLHIGTATNNGNGAYLSTGGVWTNGCSRTFKENFTKPDPDKILELVKKLDIFRYNYKGDIGITHISPVAEDFYELFKTGNDERYLAGLDVSGVALLAIKALVKENEEILSKVENNCDEIIQLNIRINNLTSENQKLISEIEQMRTDIEMLKNNN